MSYTRLGFMAVLVLVWCCGVSSVQAKVAVVTTHAGKVLQGELIAESDDVVTLRIAGIPTPIKRENISKIEFRKTPKEEYLERRAALKDSDVDGRWKLAREMFDRKELDLANIELQSLKRDFPDNADVKLLSTIVEERIKLRAERAARTSKPRTPKPRPGKDAKRPGQPTDADRLSPDDMLTDAQINMLRLWELPGDLSQMGPRIVVPRETVEKFFKQYAQDEATPRGRAAQDRFRRLPDWRKLDRIFRVQARPLYEEIEVRADPPVLLTYRQQIYRGYITAYFYRHFGQGQYPGLYLYGPNSGARGALTNFYILSTFSLNGRPLIDRQEPERSLLLQWGLPRDEAYDPAPEVAGWRPFFQRGTSDPRFGEFVNWIASLYPDVDYGIAYTLPVPPGKKPQPATDAGTADTKKNKGKNKNQ